MPTRKASIEFTSGTYLLRMIERAADVNTMLAFKDLEIALPRDIEIFISHPFLDLKIFQIVHYRGTFGL